MYESPIQIMYDEIYKKVSDELDHKIFQTVVNANITVDRGELLKALAYDRGQYGKGYGDGYQDGKRDAWEWISVEERLPGSDKYVLCCGSKGGMFVGSVCDIILADGKVTAFVHGGRGRHITHWMPLPEPPKEVEE